MRPDPRPSGPRLPDLTRAMRRVSAAAFPLTTLLYLVGCNGSVGQADLRAASGLDQVGQVISNNGSAIVAAGGGNIVAAGGGNIVAAGGGNIVAAGGGNIVAGGGGNLIGKSGAGIVAGGGGNFSLVSGLVRAPAGIVAAGGGNIVAGGGGNIVAGGGGNIVAGGGGNIVAGGGGNFQSGGTNALAWAGAFASRHVLALDDRPLAGAEVFLADAHGKAFEGLAHGLTDEKGFYKIARVPIGFNFTVVVKVKTSNQGEAELKTLVHSAEGSNQADVTFATTMVSELCTQSSSDRAVGDFSSADFQKLVEVVLQGLTTTTVPDLTKVAEVTSRAETLLNASPEIKELVGQVVHDVTTKIEVSIEVLEGAIEEAKNTAAPDSSTPNSPPSGDKNSTGSTGNSGSTGSSGDTGSSSTNEIGAEDGVEEFVETETPVKVILQ